MGRLAVLGDRDSAIAAALAILGWLTTALMAAAAISLLATAATGI